MPDNTSHHQPRRQFLRHSFSFGLGLALVPKLTHSPTPAQARSIHRPISTSPTMTNSTVASQTTSAASSPVTVTIRLTAKAEDCEPLINHLARALPTTRQYQGCRYSNTYIQPDAPRTVVLLQGWDSREAQQSYIAWRQETGELQQLLALVEGDPVVEYWQLNAA